MSSSGELKTPQRPLTAHAMQGRRLGEIETLTPKHKTQNREDLTAKRKAQLKRIDERFRAEHPEAAALLDRPRTRPKVGFTDQAEMPVPEPAPHRPVLWMPDDPLTHHDLKRKARGGRGEAPADFQARKAARRRKN